MAKNNKKVSREALTLPPRIRLFGFRKSYKDGLYYAVEVDFLYDKPVAYNEKGPYYLFEAAGKMDRMIHTHKQELMSNAYLQEEVSLEDEGDE